MSKEGIHTLGLSIKEENLINAAYSNNENTFQNLLKELQTSSINLFNIKDSRCYTCKFH